MGKLLKTTEPYSELQILHMLVDDFYYNTECLGNSGVENLNKLVNFIDQIQGLIMHDEYYEKYGLLGEKYLKEFDVPPWKKGK